LFLCSQFIEKKGTGNRSKLRIFTVPVFSIENSRVDMELFFAPGGRGQPSDGTICAQLLTIFGAKGLYARILAQAMVQWLSERGVSTGDVQLWADNSGVGLGKPIRLTTLQCQGALALIGPVLASVLADFQEQQQFLFGIKGVKIGASHYGGKTTSNHAQQQLLAMVGGSGDTQLEPNMKIDLDVSESKALFCCVVLCCGVLYVVCLILLCCV